LKPKHLETQDALLKLQAGQEDWAGVRKTLNAKLKHGFLPRDVHRRRDGVFALSQARELHAAGKLDASHARAFEANKLTPGLVPAAILLAQGYLEKGKPKLASKTLCAAWSIGPHPELASSFAAIVFSETPMERLDRFLALTKTAPNHPETKMVLAELNIAAEKFGRARVEMGDLASADPTMRSLTIMAAIERGEGGGDQAVQEILTKALSAQRDPQWVCENCGNISHEWEPVCVNCETIDSVSWKRPPVSDVVSSKMLPLIIGQTSADDTDAVQA
jgi:HemY protein